MKANKKMYPGGGMLRNKYADGGAVDRFRSAVYSNPGIKSLRWAVGKNPLAMTPEQKARMGALSSVMKAGAAQSAGYSPAAVAAMASRAKTYAAPAKATSTTAPSRAASVMPSSMAQSRPAYVPPGGGSKPTAQRAVPANKYPMTPAPAQRAGAATAAKSPAYPYIPQNPPFTATQRASAPTAQGGSFSQAFAKARADKKETFTWNGKQYTTQLKGESAAKPQTRDTTPVQMIPSKVVTSVSKPYLESPTGKITSAPAKTSLLTLKPGPVGDVDRGLAAAQSATEQRKAEQSKASTPTAQSTQYFKPGTMADYLEERRRKMQGNLMTKR